MNPDEQAALDGASASVMAAMLAAAKGPAWFSAVLQGVTLLGHSLCITDQSIWVSTAAAVLLLWQLLLAWRMALDAHLFHAFALSALSPSNLDDVLSEMGRHKQVSADRSMTDRVRGGWRLLRQQALLTSLTLALMLASNVLMPSAPHV
ncbi:hypothetical protein C7S18_07135 [Ahniella affigens]|uniref:Uncharacterized protein n=1 Tax=Ahniella affigens TaxID=2021234 RepID=A0A2P1PQ70_9GAMM|nr:hypothetical protein [Ahniella affigens]AVP96984.1 hypothetical protein C7S18_07135 [Ahniella affigens]